MFDFGATWCGPCRTISPVFEKLAEAHTDVAFYSVDIDVAEDVAKLVDIRSVRRSFLHCVIRLIARRYRLSSRSGVARRSASSPAHIRTG
jgi:thiol-disulfide isomerase/thioredoxin